MTRLSNDMFLYTETITRTATTDELTVPIGAVPNWRPRTGPDNLEYQTLVDGKPWAGLETYAVVASHAPIEGNRYVLEEGETADFTFVALLVLPPTDSVRTKIPVAFDVTSFPEQWRWESETFILSTN